jgi:DNA-binding GntR family transcriptional regulator
MVEAAASGKGSDVIECDVFFHRRICEISGSRWALRAFNDLYAEVRLLMAVSEPYFESMEASSAAHYRVVEALRTRDPEQAVSAMVEHIADPWQKLAANRSEAQASRRA